LARYRGSVCRLCRREGEKLFLKGERCFKEKCSVERRTYAPGQHGQRSRKISDYGLQLREKQKVRRIYGVLEKQFRNYFKDAEKKRGVTGDNLLISLERRLDNAVYSLGFASSRAQARQLVRHGHVVIDGQKTTIPSYQVKTGQQISIKQSSRKNEFVRASVETARGRGIPNWLDLDPENFIGKVTAMPTRDDIKNPIEEQLIVELYSR